MPTKEYYYDNDNGEEPKFQTIDLTDGGQIVIGEAAESGSFVRSEGENSSITVKFRIWGAENASVAYIAMMNYLHTWFDDGYGGIANYDLPLDTVQLSSTANQYAYTADCVFQYRPSSNDSSSYNQPQQSEINQPSYTVPEVEDSNYSFDTTGGSAHVKYGLALLGSARYDGGTPINFGGMVNPNDDGTAAGCDIVAPSMSFQIALSLPKFWFTSAYRNVIAQATGCINSAPWGGYLAGNVLFKGVQASVAWMKWTNPLGFAMRDWYWRATYSFEAAASKAIVVGNTTLVKRGFDYASQVSSSYADPTTGATITAVEQVDILQMYPAFDFANLMIPLPS